MNYNIVCALYSEIPGGAGIHSINTSIHIIISGHVYKSGVYKVRIFFPSVFWMNMNTYINISLDKKFAIFLLFFYCGHVCAKIGFFIDASVINQLIQLLLPLMQYKLSIRQKCLKKEIWIFGDRRIPFLNLKKNFFLVIVLKWKMPFLWKDSEGRNGESLISVLTLFKV